MTKRKNDISDSINGLVEETRESFIAQVHNIKWYDVKNVMDHIKAEIVTNEESSCVGAPPRSRVVEPGFKGFKMK